MFKKILFALFLLSATPAFAQVSLYPDEAPKVNAKLIADSETIVPGKMFWVSMRQEITPQWHTYWENPGDTGLATTLKWELPQGFKVTKLLFPTPHRQKIGELVNYGYENSVMLLAQVTPPANLEIGKTYELKAKGSWLVCQEICIPETANFTLKLQAAQTATPSAWASAFIAAKNQLPKNHRSTQKAKVNDHEVEITLSPLPLNADELPEEAYFFPHDGLLIQHAADQKLQLEGRTLKLIIPRNKARTTPVNDVTGEIWMRNYLGEKSFRFTAAIEQPKAAVVTPAAINAETTTTPQSDIGLMTAIISAFLGGILLNLMPCVFPVLSLKALGLVHKSHQKDRRAVLTGGLAYLAGVLAAFTLLGLILIGLKTAGAQIGWGVQLQSPTFVAALAVLLFFIGYTLSGAVTFGTRLMGVGDKLTKKTSLAGSFFTGALAVVVATPCTAPFMGGAIFYALTQNAAITLFVLWMLGLGLALPYVLLTLFPEVLLKYLPKPGVWMEHFKQFLAFPMLAAAIWLVWVLGQQTGASGVLYVLFSMLFLAFGFWLCGTTRNRPASLWQSIKSVLGILAILLSIGMIWAQPEPVSSMNNTNKSEDANYEAFTPEKLAEYRAAGNPVFVNMTAAWCITCLANEKAALSTDTVKDFFKKNNILYLKGDWTNYDANITSYLKEFGRSGVPIYVFYPADQSKAPVILPQLLTPRSVIDSIHPSIQGK